MLLFESKCPPQALVLHAWSLPGGANFGVGSKTRTVEDLGSTFKAHFCYYLFFLFPACPEMAVLGCIFLCVAFMFFLTVDTKSMETSGIITWINCFSFQVAYQIYFITVIQI